MSTERVTWWVVFGVFSIVLLSTLFGAYITLFALTIPEGLAFLLGLIVFLLLGNRLLFGYSSLTLTLDAFLSDREIDRRKLMGRAKGPAELTKELSILSLILMWMKDLDYYRYAYYSMFSLLLLIAVLTKLNLFGSLSVGNYVEGSFWGACVVTLFVWSLDTISHYLVGEALAKETG